LNHQPKSEALEKDVAAERQRVEAAVDAIQQRLTPGQLVDEILTYSQHAGTGLAANLSKAVAANPIPAALIGVGLIWLMLAQKPVPASPGTSPTTTPPEPDAD
jgi:hypothetical protein